MKEPSQQTLQDTVFFFSGGEEFERNPAAEKAEISWTENWIQTLPPNLFYSENLTELSATIYTKIPCSFIFHLRNWAQILGRRIASDRINFFSSFNFPRNKETQ